MKINIDNKTICSVNFTDFEIAWKIEDFPFVLKHLQKRDKVVFGGDILNNKMQHTYDNWYYNIDNNIDYYGNVTNSIDLAYAYLTNYIMKYGDCFNVVFVIDGSFESNDLNLSGDGLKSLKK